MKVSELIEELQKQPQDDDAEFECGECGACLAITEVSNDQEGHTVQYGELVE